MKKSTEQTKKLSTNFAYKCDNFYGPNAKVLYTDLEKGLLLFVYLSEKSGILKSNARIWNKLRNCEICYHTIVRNNSHDFYHCQYDHSEVYQQKNLCREWYTRSCNGKNCEKDHFFISNKVKRYINSDTDLIIWDFIRFIRYFFLHFRQSAISANDVQSLYQQILLIIFHIIDNIFRDTEKLNLFLPSSTINRLNPQALRNLAQEKTYALPEVFLSPERIHFNSQWYSQSSRKNSISWKNLSEEFKEFLADLFG